MPKIERAKHILKDVDEGRKGITVDSYFSTFHCFVCRSRNENEICNNCVKNVPLSIAILASRLRVSERKYATLQEICRSCTGHTTNLDADTGCISIDCPIYFKRKSQLEKVRLCSRWTKSMNELEHEEILKLNWFDLEF